MQQLALRAAIVVVCVLGVTGGPSCAQSHTGLPPTDELYKTVAALDAAVFGAFNSCDLEKFGSYFVEDVEFYHDNGGVTLGRPALVASIKTNICGKTRRELVAGTLEVYPMKGYGAIEKGVHRFYDLTSATPTQPVGEAQFVHLWQFKDGAWKITRVLSFDHHPLK
jgi:hypothetical protein